MPQPHKKHRSETFRLKGWDYRNIGAYFITICTKNKEHFFGECANSKMKLSTMGIIAQGCWYQIPRLNTHIELGQFVVMPNHIHGILVISTDVNIATQEGYIAKNNEQGNSKDEKHPYYQKISPKSNSISRVIQQYKRAVTYHINKAFSDNNFAWQSLFHDHIIRNHESFINISNYIINNPNVWEDDTFNDSKVNQQ